MKRIGYILVIMLTLLFCEQAKAIGCTNEEKELFQKYANNITYTIEPVIDEENNSASFNLTFSGVYLKFRVVYTVESIDAANYLPGESGDFSDVRLTDLEAGGMYVFQIKGVSRCYTHNFRTFTINLPKYNPYSNYDICKDAREYKLCQRWADVNVDYDTLVQKVNEYKESKKVVEEEKIKPTQNNNLFYEIYSKYYWYFLVALIIILSILIHLWIKEQKKNRL